MGNQLLTGLYNIDKSTDFPFEFLLNASDEEWLVIHADNSY